MKMKSVGNQTTKAIIRGILYAVIVSLALVLFFAFLILMTGMPAGFIKPGTQIIKVLSIFWGTVVALRHIEKRGWMFGALVGLLYTVVIFFIFSILDKDFGITSGLVADGLFACAIGAISAMIVRTLRARTV